MSRFTPQQKEAFLNLTRRYSPASYEIVNRGAADGISVWSHEEAKTLDEFADRICAQVGRDHPDYLGRDEDINADAQMIVHTVSKILADDGFSR
jgi:hypothetical protein